MAEQVWFLVYENDRAKMLTQHESVDSLIIDLRKLYLGDDSKKDVIWRAEPVGTCDIDDLLRVGIPAILTGLSPLVADVMQRAAARGGHFKGLVLPPKQ